MVTIQVPWQGAGFRSAIALLVVTVLLAVTPAAMAIDDYPYPAANPGAVDPWGFYYRYCTSFVAWRMNRDGGKMTFYNYMAGGHWGDAGGWGANAQKLGYPVDAKPAIGAIAWWAAGTISRSGHVAYVEAVNADGTIVVEDYNYASLRYDRRTIQATGLKAPSGYIHIHDMPPPDTIPPVITLTCIKNGATYASAVTPAFSATDGALKSVTAVLDGAPFTSGALVDAPGPHTLTVTATDVAGNRATSTAAFTIDPAAVDPDVAFTTIAGLDRYETAVRVSQAAFQSASNVVIATGENWPDALGGAALAGALEAPILLTRSGSLPPSVLAEIDRLGATSAVILGGDGAVATSVESALKTLLGEDAVDRIGGEDRYETAESIACAVVDGSGDAYDGTCFVATGADFPDALAASPLSAAKRWPLVLVPPGADSESPTATLDALGVSSAIVLGGATVVAESVEASLVAQLGDGAVVRLSGADRYETAAKIAGYAAAQGLRWDGAAIATAQGFPDALAGGVLQGRLGSVMLLTRSAALVPEARDLLTANKAAIHSLRYLGGEGAVCTGVKLSVSQALE
ncbi:MAG: cell wall-binding repeat-containing protein [Coriobacteriia bacterium]